MDYEKYQEMAVERIADGRISKNYKVMSRTEFNDWIRPIEKSSELSDDRGFQLAYELVYKRLRKLAEEKGFTEEVKKLDECFTDISKKLDL